MVPEQGYMTFEEAIEEGKLKKISGRQLSVDQTGRTVLFHHESGILALLEDNEYQFGVSSPRHPQKAQRLQR
jgi:hypothetical protein